jgi:citrate lyase beta subunit
VTADAHSIRSIIETPLLDDRKWAKIPSLDVDAIIIDLEDSVPVARKDEARSRAVELLRNRASLGSRRLIVRPNHLSTRWGRDDLQALASNGAENFMYPKIQKASDLSDAASVLREIGVTPRFYPIIETPQALLDIERIAQVEGTVALVYGPADLTTAAGIALYEPDGAYNPWVVNQLTQMVVVGAAHGLATFGPAFGPNIRDSIDIRRRVEVLRRAGCTGVITFYPPHLDIIRDVFTPSAEQVGHARELIDAYEVGLAAGSPAVLRPDGMAILIHDYLRAKSLVDSLGTSPSGVMR